MLPPDCMKIGLTRTSPQHRASELSRMSAIPAPFQIEHCCHVTDVVVAERRLHLLLDQARINSKEFFRVSLATIKDLCEAITAFEQEDDSVSDQISLSNTLLAAHYGPKCTLRSQKLIYAMMADTVNNTPSDHLLRERRFPVDGFLSLDQVSQFLSINRGTAVNALRGVVRVGQSLICHPIDRSPMFSVFHFVRYRNGHATWKFSDEVRRHFTNPKL